MTIRCGNHHATHGNAPVYHLNRESVRDCYNPQVPTFLCSWLVLAGHDEDGRQIERECGALAYETHLGWNCENGHQHLTYGSEAQQAEERVEAAVEHLASRDRRVAGRLDAGETYQQIAWGL